MKTGHSAQNGRDSWEPRAKQQPYARRNLRAVAARWDARAPGWDEALINPSCHLNEDDAYPRFLKVAKGIIRRRRIFCRSHGVIDAGCGTGIVLATVAASFKWGLGIDISSQMLRAARRKQIPNARFLKGSCFELSRMATRAGAVFSRGVLLSHYGLKHGQELLTSAYSALVPGGFFMCDFLNQAARNQFQHKTLGKTYFSRREAGDLARMAGFRRARVLGKDTQRVLILLSHK